MKVLEIIPSRERCAEAGWYAYDFVLSRPMDDKFIEALRPLGSFLYMRMLRKPFFKVESEHFLLKGIQGDNFFRMAVHGDYPEKVENVDIYITGLKMENQEVHDFAPRPDGVLD